MQCPDCRGELAATSYEDIDIHYCPGCNGRLLDEEKLQKIESSRIEIIKRNKKYSKSRYFEKSRDCPACDVPMQKSKYGKFTPRNIDKCPQCSSIWLDEGELEDLQVAQEMYEENINRRK